MPSCISFLFSRRDIQGCILLLEVLKFKNYILGIFEIIYFFCLSPDQFTRGKATFFKVLIPDYYCYHILKWSLLPPKVSRIYVYSERLKCSIHSEPQGASEVQ